MVLRTILITFILFKAVLNSFSIGPVDADAPASVKLSGLAEQKLIGLNGEWNFAWKKLVRPEEISSIDPAEIQRVRVPEKWNDYTIKGTRLPADGYATYWIDLEFEKSDVGKNFAFYIPEIPTAYTLWLDTNIVASNGTVGTDPATSIPRSYPKIAFFTVDKQKSTLSIQISNFHDYNSGLWKTIVIGTREQILTKKIIDLAYDLFFFGGFFAIGIYHLILFLLRKKEKAVICFSILCLSISIRSLLTGEFFLFTLFPDFSWQVYIQFNFFLIYTAALAFSLFIAYTYETYYHKPIKYAFSIVSILFFALLFVRIGKIYLYSWEIYQYFLVAIFCYIFFIIIKAIVNRVEGAFINIIAFAISFVCICNDILYGKALIQTGNLAPIGLFSFTISQSAILAIKFSSTFTRMEVVSKRLKKASIAVKKKNILIQHANKELQELYSELDTSQKEITYRLSQIAETRSRETGNHVKRVAAYTIFLAREYSLPAEEVELLGNAAPMHDVGKMAIPDEILNKQGKLTPGEFETMKAHTTIGYAILRNSGRKILNAASIIALQHHERYNGSGYPDGRASDSIHIYGRIVAIADVFDALASDRCYKKAWPMEQIVEYFKTENGGHFDPKLADIFLHNLTEFEDILSKYKDTFNV